jgi:hypothetical protein
VELFLDIVGIVFVWIRDLAESLKYCGCITDFQWFHFGFYFLEVAGNKSDFCCWLGVGAFMHLKWSVCFSRMLHTLTLYVEISSYCDYWDSSPQHSRTSARAAPHSRIRKREWFLNLCRIIRTKSICDIMVKQVSMKEWIWLLWKESLTSIHYFWLLVLYI